MHRSREVSFRSKRMKNVIRSSYVSKDRPLLTSEGSLSIEGSFSFEGTLFGKEFSCSFEDTSSLEGSITGTSSIAFDDKGSCTGLGVEILSSTQGGHDRRGGQEASFSESDHDDRSSSNDAFFLFPERERAPSSRRSDASVVHGFRIPDAWLSSIHRPTQPHPLPPRTNNSSPSSPTTTRSILPFDRTAFPFRGSSLKGTRSGFGVRLDEGSMRSPRIHEGNGGATCRNGSGGRGGTGMKEHRTGCRGVGKAS